MMMELNPPKMETRQYWASKSKQLQNHTPERVSVRSNQDLLSLQDLRLDLSIVERQSTLSRHLETLPTWRRHVEATPPDVHLVLSPLLPCIVFVQARQLAVVTLVQGLVLGDVDPRLTESVEEDGECGLSSAQG